MGATANSGPFVQFGQAPNSDNNPDRAPAMIDVGSALLDPRQFYGYAPGQNQLSTKTYCFMSSGQYICIDQAPSTAAANNIAASQSPGAGAIALVSASGAGITVGTTITRPDTGAQVSGLLAIDTAAAGLAFGQSGQFNAWDPTKMISRAVVITSGGNDSGINFTVNGYDLYGYPMTQTLAGGNAAAVTTTKAFKYIASVTHTGSVAGTVQVGTADVFGFPLLVNRFFYVDLFWNNAYITSTTGFTAADTTSPATASTGDVRGTYATQSASDGTKRLQVQVQVSVANAGTVAGSASAAGSPTGLFGVTQF